MMGGKTRGADDPSSLLDPGKLSHCRLEPFASYHHLVYVQADRLNAELAGCAFSAASRERLRGSSLTGDSPLGRGSRLGFPSHAAAVEEWRMRSTTGLSMDQGLPFQSAAITWKRLAASRSDIFPIQRPFFFPCQTYLLPR